MARLLPWALALLAGLAQAASIASPWDGQPRWWLQILSLALVAGVLQRQASWRRAALLGWLFALAWLAATWWWLFISMHVYGGLAAPLAVAAVLALAAFLGSYYAAACGVFRAVARTEKAHAALFFGAFWLLAELMRGRWFTGFPWGAAGYAHVEGPLAAFAPWVGVYGIGWLAACLAYLLSLSVRPEFFKSWRYWSSLLAIAMFPALADVRQFIGDCCWRNPTLSVALLQGDIPQDEKFQGRTGVRAALQWYGAELRSNPASLIVAPETAIPLLPDQLPADYLSSLGDSVAGGGRALLLGIPLGSLSEGYTNSAIGIRSGAEVYRYDKHHLVPFGEFIPPMFRWFTDLMNIPLGDFNRGPVGQASFEWQGQRLAPTICYEDLFGEELAVRFADPAHAPTILVNLSNIAWFGDTVAIDQHLQISRMRSLEFARPTIRATNTGATAIIDHRGIVTQLLPRHTRGVLSGQVEGRGGLTPYARWVRVVGLWPLWIAAGAIALAAVLYSRRRAVVF